MLALTIGYFMSVQIITARQGVDILSKNPYALIYWKNHKLIKASWNFGKSKYKLEFEGLEPIFTSNWFYMSWIRK